MVLAVVVSPIKTYEEKKRTKQGWRKILIPSQGAHEPGMSAQHNGMYADIAQSGRRQSVS